MRTKQEANEAIATALCWSKDPYKEGIWNTGKGTLTRLPDFSTERTLCIIAWKHVAGMLSMPMPPDLSHAVGVMLAILDAQEVKQIVEKHTPVGEVETGYDLSDVHEQINETMMEILREEDC